MLVPLLHNMYAMNNILRPLALFASIFLAGTLGAQTIIPLQRGQGGIRSKPVDDYKREQHTDKREQSESLAYVDNLRRAFNALYADSLGQAETLFNEALKLRPAAEGNHIIKYNLGLVDMARGRNVQAVEKLTAVIKDYPNYFDARLARAEANLQLGRAAEAQDDAQQVLDQPELDGITPQLLCARSSPLSVETLYRSPCRPAAHHISQPAKHQRANTRCPDTATNGPAQGGTQPP